MSSVLAILATPALKKRIGLLIEQADLEPVFATGVEQAKKKLAGSTPAAILVEVGDQADQQSLESLRDLHPRSPVLALVPSSASPAVAQALLQGAADCCYLDALDTQLPHALQQVIRLAELYAERQEVLEEEQGRIRQLVRLNEATEELLLIKDLPGLLDRGVELLADLMDVEIASLMLLEDDGERLRIRAARGLTDEVVQATENRIGQGISGWVAREGKPLLVPDLEQDPRFCRPSHDQYRGKALLSVPLKVGERTIGVLNSNNKRDGMPFSRRDMDVLVLFANQAAMAIENARLHLELETAVADFRRLAEIKNDHLSGVVYDLRAPLGALLQALEALRKRSVEADDTEGVKLTGTALVQTEALQTMIDELLSVYRMEAGRQPPFHPAVSVAEVIRDALKRNAAVAETLGAELKAAADQELPLVAGDREKLTEAIGKLVQLALRLSSGGAVVVEGKFLGGRRTSDRSDFVRVDVCSQGSGPAAEELDQLFSRFYSALDGEGALPGGALGLFIARGVVEAHGGKIWIEKAEGRGTRFSALLPVSRRSV